MKKIISIYSLIFILFSVFYSILFHSPLFGYQKVLFYRGISLLAFNVLFFLILTLIYYFKFSKKNIESVIAAIIIATSINLSIFVVFPVTFERSITMYLLNVLATNKTNYSCQGLTENQLQNKLVQEYVIKNKAIDKRVNEQKIINNVEDNKNCVKLTNQGINFINFSYFIKQIYNLK